MTDRMARLLPILNWLKDYRVETFVSDGLAAVIVTLMLVPQALAYALLAGLPPEVGLYASMIPLVAYALFGTSATLAVGPVAVASLMTASALGGIAESGTPEYVGAAIVLATLSGLMLFAMGLLRLGFLANFLSHPVISGFVTASGILIAGSQLGPLLGVDSGGHNLLEMVDGLWRQVAAINPVTAIIGSGTLIFLYLCRNFLRQSLTGIGFSERLSDLCTRAAPVTAVIATTAFAWHFDLGTAGVRLIGEVPSGMPDIRLPSLDPELWATLMPAAFLISLVGFVESVSVAQTLAAKRRQRIEPNSELVALGLANVASGFSGASPVSGGFSRSVVNFEAGARTPIAGILTAVGIAIATLTLTGLLAFLPKATLAATIIVAVSTLIDLPAVRRTLAYSRADGAAMLATIILTLLQGVETGIIAGVALSISLYLYRTSRPHSAVIGRIPGTEHFRNIQRHEVEVDDSTVFLRIDASLYFANARYLEDTVLALVSDNPHMKNLVLACQSVNEIDASALESLETINSRLGDAGICLNLAEVKGPIMDRLKTTHFCDELTGQVFLSTYDAWQLLTDRSSAD